MVFLGGAVLANIVSLRSHVSSRTMLTRHRWRTRRTCGYQRQSGRSREHVHWRSWARDNQRDATRSLRSSKSRPTKEQMTKYCAPNKAILPPCLRQAHAVPLQARATLFICACCVTTIAPGGWPRPKPPNAMLTNGPKPSEVSGESDARSFPSSRCRYGRSTKAVKHCAVQCRLFCSGPLQVQSFFGPDCRG